MCRHAAEGMAHHWFWLLNQNYQHADVVDGLTSAGGYCPRHAAEMASQGKAYTTSVLLADVLRRLNSAIDEQPVEPCPAQRSARRPSP